MSFSGIARGIGRDAFLPDLSTREKKQPFLSSSKDDCFYKIKRMIKLALSV